MDQALATSSKLISVYYADRYDLHSVIHGKLDKTIFKRVYTCPKLEIASGLLGVCSDLISMSSRPEWLLSRKRPLGPGDMFIMDSIYFVFINHKDTVNFRLSNVTLTDILDVQIMPADIVDKEGQNARCDCED